MVSKSGRRPSEDDIIKLNGDEIDNEVYWDASEHFEHDNVSGIQSTTSGLLTSSSFVVLSPSLLTSHSVSSSVSASVPGSGSVPGSVPASVSFESPSVPSGSASGLPDGCSTYLPSVSSNIWNKLPDGLVTDTPQPVDLHMDPGKQSFL